MTAFLSTFASIFKYINLFLVAFLPFLLYPNSITLTTLKHSNFSKSHPKILL